MTIARSTSMTSPVDSRIRASTGRGTGTGSPWTISWPHNRHERLCGAFGWPAGQSAARTAPGGGAAGIGGGV